MGASEHVERFQKCDRGLCHTATSLIHHLCFSQLEQQLHWWTLRRQPLHRNTRRTESDRGSAASLQQLAVPEVHRPCPPKV
eukprot:6893303-Prymnesium_polylepis.1